MEVKLDKQYPLDVSPEQAWAVLADVRAVAACMPGAQITEQLDETHFKGTVKTRIGPASMQFGGDIELLALDAASRSLQMLGKGADRGGSSASMNLSARIEAAPPGQAGCVLVGQATVTVSGKLAQFGSRLLVPVSDAMLAQFADNFRTAAAAAAVTGAPAGPAAHAAAPADATVPVATDTAPGADRAQAAADSGSSQSEAGDGGGAATMAPPAPATVAPAPRPTELNALALLWVVVRQWWAGLFRKKG